MLLVLLYQSHDILIQHPLFFLPVAGVIYNVMKQLPMKKCLVNGITANLKQMTIINFRNAFYGEGINHIAIINREIRIIRIESLDYSLIMGLQNLLR